MHGSGDRKRRSASLFVVLAGLAAIPFSAPAQVTGAVSGRVDDATGASIGSATITVKSLETGATRTVTTDPSGHFRVAALPIGRLEVRAEKTGFKAAVRTGINLEVGQDAVVNFELQVGEFAQQVIVSAEAPIVNTTTASVSGVVGEREIKDLPLNGRSFDSLIALNPGAINYSALKSANTSTSDGNTFSVAGRRPQDNEFLLNGIEYTGSSQLAVTPGGASGYLLGIDAVREFNVLTDTYGAEYGKRSGAQVVVVTQSGSNALHGTLFEFLRNSALDSPGAFDQGTVAPLRRNQFGGALGGPLKKDRVFLFGNYEGFRQSYAPGSRSIVPDDNARNGQLPNGNQVPGLDSRMKQFMSFFPVSNGATLPAVSGQPGAALAYANPKQTIREDFGTVRSDYVLTSRDTLSGAYTIDDGDNLLPLADPLFGSTTVLRSQVASVEETHVLSPHMLNTLRAGYSRAAFNLESAVFTSIPSDLSFVKGAGPGGIVIGGGVTTTGSGTITSAGPNNAAGSWNRRNLYTVTDSVQINRGMHQISFGIWLQRMQDNQDSASRQLGQATFTSLTTFLQGTVSSFQVVPSANELGWRSLFGAWFFEDALKLRPNLTLQLGVRHEFSTGWNEVSGRAANYLTDSTGVLITDPRVGGSAFTANNATRLFAPRVGLAWDPFGNGKTAIRAGFGTYFSQIDALAFLLNSLPPYNGSLTFSGPLFNIIPQIPNVPPPPTCGPGVSTACTTYAPQGVQPNAKVPTVQEWNFSVEQQLSRDTAVRLAYVGSFGYHGLLSVDPNTIPAQICSDPNGCQAGGTTPGGTPATAANQSHQARGAQYIPVGTRPNRYLGAGFFWYTEGNSSYNALQVDVSKRLSQGFQIRGNYTWSKNLDMNSGLTGAQANNQAQMILNRNDPRRDWGPSALNVAHQVSISAHYELPFGHGKHWLGNAGGFEDKLLGGWQVNGITTLLSGFPFTPVIGSNRSGDGDTRNPDRPSLNPAFTGPVILGNPLHWFDPRAFVLPAAGTYGDLGRGVYSGPGLAEMDLSIFKNTAITERTNLQFRTEFFNLFNRTNYGTPSATAFSSGAPNLTSGGVITTLATLPRQIQFGLKLIF
ncbi:MAG TPA: carboxypeptidase regulatory-like domain-containing protein [Bryobacteraceae bacterium]|nr:carboxypeptidase regulatory-like domain-containing protein [Bryobacteraceae bacterium]